MTFQDPYNTKTMETGGSFVNISTAAAVWCFKACVTKIFVAHTQK